MTDMLRRIQLSRRKGWRMPANTVKVARPGKWGNAFIINKARRTHDGLVKVPANRAEAVALYRDDIEYHLTGLNAREMHEALAELRGKNLACWCHLCERHKDGLPLGETCPDCAPCHADTLLELANR